MPQTAGISPLRIEALVPESEKASVLTQPAFVEWSWFYNFPAFPLWVLVVLLLVVPKRNRSKQAWWILLPLGILTGIGYLPAVSLFGNSEQLDRCRDLVEWGALGWSVVYLTAPWLATRWRFATFFLVLAVMCAVGVVPVYCLFRSLTMDAVPYVLRYAVSMFTLLFWMMLTSWGCRKKFTPRRFSFLQLAIMGIILVLAAYLALMLDGCIRTDIAFRLKDVVPAVVLSSMALYLLNLPFLLLAFYCPYYRQRFERIFQVGNCGKLSLSEE